jgi:hypothetical protein
MFRTKRFPSDGHRQTRRLARPGGVDDAVRSRWSVERIFFGTMMIDFGVGSSLGKKIGATLLMQDRETLD